MYCECEPFFFFFSKYSRTYIASQHFWISVQKKKHLRTLYVIYFMYAACTDGSKTRRSASQITLQIQAVLM